MAIFGRTFFSLSQPYLLPNQSGPFLSSSSHLSHTHPCPHHDELLFPSASVLVLVLMIPTTLSPALHFSPEKSLVPCTSDLLAASPWMSPGPIIPLCPKLASASSLKPAPHPCLCLGLSLTSSQARALYLDWILPSPPSPSAPWLVCLAS